MPIKVARGRAAASIDAARLTALDRAFTLGREDHRLRRKLEWIAPVFLIALWVQFFAPVMAQFAMAADADPLAGAPICALAHAPTAPSQPAHHAGACCIFCTQAHANFIFVAAPAMPLKLRVVLGHHDRGPARDHPRALRLLMTAQARAPPALS